jgi:miniconductance mechanosensitive channel
MFTSISDALEKLLIDSFGIPANTVLIPKTILLVLGAFMLMFVVWRISRWMLHKAVPKVTSKTKTIWDDVIFSKRVISAIALLVPALLLDYMAPAIFKGLGHTLPFVTGATNIIIVFTLAWIIGSVFNGVNAILAGNPDFKDKPIGSITQLGKIFVYSIAFVLAISIIFDKSPILLLSGFGAIAAVVLLVFKDSILGFVASVQLSANNMVHVGDWVTVPKYNADGDVQEINLTTIKVQNFDNTITTIPTYAFVSDSFTNWRGMQQSPGRRIKRAVHIQIQSIRFCTPEMIERFKKIQLVSDHITQRQQEIERYNKEHQIDGSVLVNGRKLTNIGIFAAYLENYLKTNPNISQEMTIMVRQLSSTPNGLPLEIYAFSIHKEWKIYEGVMSDLFDHILAAAACFDLQIFENPTGTDFRKLG